MSEFFRTAIYTKNVPTAERGLRLLGAAGCEAAAVLLNLEPWLRWGLGATGAMLVFTGLFGFCPACYFAGRKLKDHAAT